MKSVHKTIHTLLLPAAIVMLGTTGVMAAAESKAAPACVVAPPAAPEPGVYIMGAIGLLIVAAYWAYRRHRNRANASAS